jgi:predicted amidohydrolase YtcJ
MHADLIVTGKRIYTMVRSRPVVQGLAIAGGRIVAAGDRRTVRRWKGPNSETIDVGEQPVVPGLTDCHAHIFAWALMRDEVALAGVASLPAALAKIAARGRRTRRERSRRTGPRRSPRTEREQWLVGNGFDKNLCGDAFPTAADLDRATGKTVPACIFSRDWHAAWLNTAALRRLNITARSADPPGGQILRDHRGRPTGILLDTAMNVLGPVRSPGPETRVRRLWRRACQIAHAYGLTGVHSVDDIDGFQWFQQARALDRLGLRVRYAFPKDTLDSLEQVRLRRGFGDAMLRVAAVKIFSDGALGSQTAWMYDPYPGRPGYCGIPVCVGRELGHAVSRAAALGLPCWVHAIGDRAVHEAVSAFAAANRRRGGAAQLLHRVEHAQCVRPTTRRLMAARGIIASVQPSHLCQDMETADRHWPAVTRYTYPFRSLRTTGITTAFGSDAPVETLNPFRGIYAAVTRQSRNGQPAGGWHPQEKLSRRSALEGYTVGAARSVGEHRSLGRLAPGYHADLAVLTQDLLACDVQELPDVRSTCTVIGGRVVYHG